MSGIGGQSGSCLRALKTSLLTQRRLPAPIITREQQHSCSLDYLIGSAKRCRRDSEASVFAVLRLMTNSELGRVRLYSSR